MTDGTVTGIYAKAGCSYSAWLRRVDTLIYAKAGCSYMDLPDRCWGNLYEYGMTPGEAVALCLEDEGFGD